eukprot:10147719-Lingulodinium_polyedra.AAC.1
MAWHGAPRRGNGVAWRGVARHGTARRGVTRRGMAWHGTACHARAELCCATRGAGLGCAVLR